MTLNRRVLHRVRSPLRSPRLNSSSLRKKALIKRLSGDVQFGADTKANLKVVVRVRPFNQREKENNANCILDVVDEYMLVFDPRREEDTFFFKGAQQRIRDLTKRQPREQKFAFERVFSTASTNEDVYNASTHDLLDTLLSGYNCSVFAYGATGAGKTYTMLGTEECPGITFLTLKELYQRIDALKEEKTFEVAVSYLEVYNEMVRDLLSTGKPLSVQEVGKQVLVPGLTLHKPGDAQELMQILIRGNLNRTQHPTDSNAESSRSHAVFQVFVKQHDRLATNLKSNVAISKLSMIDLAGSERGAATGFKGARFREGASINKSLLALGNCINALADGQRHIPYRDSKLTRLLKDSLGGNCRSVMIAAVSPASSTFEDTFNTLRYANRAKTIKTTIRKNVLNVDQHVSNYVKIVEGLREEICSLQAKIKTYEEKQGEMEQRQAATSAFPQPECTLQQKQELETRILELEMQLKTKNKEEDENGIAEVQQQVDGAIQKHKKLRHEMLRLESSQRELEFKMVGCTARLNRMKIISFASKKLDKSISRCERTIQNLANRLVQITSLKQEVRTKLTASVDHLQEVQNQLTSVISKQYIEANLALRDYHQHCQYLGGLMGEAFVEQNTSEQLICQLLRAIRQFYIHLHADNQCSPAIMEIFKSVVDNLDESKIAWADQRGGKNIGEQQQGGGNGGALKGEVSNSTTTDSANVVPQLDVKYFTSLPITPSVTISPVVTQGRPKTFRKSSMKTNTSALTLPQLPTQCLVSSQDSRNTSSLSSPFLEDEEEFPSPGQPSADDPSLVISVPHHAVPMSTVSSGMEQLDNQRVVAGNVPDHSMTTAYLVIPEATAISTTPQSMSNPSTLQSISSNQQNYTTINKSTVDALNMPDVLDIQPIRHSLNETFSATPAKILNTTVDITNCSAIMQNVQPDADSSTIRSDANLSLSDKFQGTQGRKDPVTSVFGFTSSTQQCRVAAGITIGSVIGHGTEILKGNSLNTTFSLAPVTALNTTIDLPARESSVFIHSSPTRTPPVMKEDVPSDPRLVMLSVSSDSSQETETFSHITSDASSNPHHKTLGTAEQTTHSAVRMVFPPSKSSPDSTFCISDDKSPVEAEHIPGITMKSAGAEHSLYEGEVEQRLPLQPLPDLDRNDGTGSHNTTSSVISSMGWERVMQPPPKVKLKHGVSHTPHKLNKNTPRKLGGSRTTSTSSLNKTSDEGMRRCVSTPSLAATSSGKTPTLTRKFSGLHRSFSTLKVRSAIHNQENVSPSSTKKNASHSSVYRDTVSSAAKHAVNLRKQ